MSIKMPCKPSDLEVIETAKYGKCVAFNRDEMRPRRSYKYGRESGLVLELFVSGGNESSVSGLVVLVRNQSELMRPLNKSLPYELPAADSAYTNGVLIEPGTSTNLALGRSYTIRLPAPYSDCVVSGRHEPSPAAAHVQATIQHFGTYTQAHCLDLCAKRVAKFRYASIDKKIQVIILLLYYHLYLVVGIINHLMCMIVSVRSSARRCRFQWPHFPQPTIPLSSMSRF